METTSIQSNLTQNISILSHINITNEEETHENCSNGSGYLQSNCGFFSDDLALWIINEKLFNINVPCVIFLSVCVVIGLFGNCLVVYVYGFRFRKNVAIFFIIWLSVFNIFSCVGLIFEVFDRRLPMYSGRYPMLCKAVRYVEVLSNACNIGTLICIAFDRYYKVCKPMKSFTMKKAKILLSIIIVIAIFVSCPSVMFYGTEKIETGYVGLYGYDCADDDAYKNTIFPSIFYLTVFVFMVIAFILIVVMYICVFVGIRKWRNRSIGNNTGSSNRLSSNLSDEFELSGYIGNIVEIKSKNINVRNTADLIIKRERRTPKLSGNNNVVHRISNGLKENCNTREGSHDGKIHAKQDDTIQNNSRKTESSIRILKRQKSLPKKTSRVSRMTIILSAVSLVFICSYLPYFIVEILNALSIFDETKLPVSIRRIVVVANSSFSFNHVANPFIYSFLNPVFRRELKVIVFGKDSRKSKIDSLFIIRTQISNVRHI